MGSRNQITRRRNLRGCVVILKHKMEDVYPLALNYSRSIFGLGWGFDSLKRDELLKMFKKGWY